MVKKAVKDVDVGFYAAYAEEYQWTAPINSANDESGRGKGRVEK
jgi:hypothetical protein